MDDSDARAEAAILARTILSTSHEAMCERLNGAEHSPAGAVGLLAAGAQPFLVPSDPDHFFPTGTALSCRVAIPEVGVLRCTGTTGAARLAGDDAAVVATIEDHRGCLLGPVDPAELRVVPLQLFGISVAAPGGGAAESLTPRELAAASPDWLLARGRRLTEHLEQDHAQDLAQLAAAHGVPAATAVTLSRLSTRAAQLVCLGPEGVTTVEMIFDPPVRNPAELWRRLASAQPAS